MLRRLALPVAALLLTGASAAAIQGPDALAIAKRQAAEAEARSQALERRSTAAATEADRLRAAALAAAARIEASEADITAAQARIRLVEALRARQRARLAERQAPVARLAAALQTMTRRPAALTLVQPGSIDDNVRVRALLASTLPVVRARTADLRRELAASAKLADQARIAAGALARSRADLAARRTAFAALEARQRTASSTLFGSAIDQSDRALALTEEARAIADRLDAAPERARTRASLAELPGPLLRPGTARTATARPAYALPAEGRVVTGAGEISDAGVHARGTTLAVAPGASVAAPRAGRVAFSGRYRSYGHIVILDHGGGWTSLVTGLGPPAVARGRAVGSGTPLGRAAGREIMIELRHNGRPIPPARLL